MQNINLVKNKMRELENKEFDILVGATIDYIEEVIQDKKFNLSKDTEDMYKKSAIILLKKSLEIGSICKDTIALTDIENRVEEGILGDLDKLPFGENIDEGFIKEPQFNYSSLKNIMEVLIPEVLIEIIPLILPQDYLLELLLKFEGGKIMNDLREFEKNIDFFNHNKKEENNQKTDLIDEVLRDMFGEN